SETTDRSVTEETLDETSNEGSGWVEEATQETNQGQTRDDSLRSSINLSIAEIKSMADYLGDYLEMEGQTEGIEALSHAMFLAVMEYRLISGNIPEITDKLGWEKGAKIQQKFFVGNSDLEITDVAADYLSMSLKPGLKGEDGVKYNFFDTYAGILHFRSLVLPSDESSYYEFVESSGEMVFYSEDKTICYRINIKSDQLVLDIERVQAKTSTNVISEDISSVKIFLRLNKNFQSGYLEDNTIVSLRKLPVVNLPFSYSFFQNYLDVPTIEPPKIKTHAKENISLVLNDEPEKLDLSEFVSVSNTMKETVGNESQISYEWLAKPDTSKIGKTTGTIKTTEKYGEYVNTDTAEVSFTVINDSLSATAISQTIPLGTSVESLDVKGFVKEVKLGNTSLTNEQYSVKLVDTVTTDIVGKQTVKVEISLNSDSAVKTTVEVPVEIEWGNSIVFKDDFNNNGFRFTAASISLLKGPNGPQLVATRGDGFRNAGSVLFYARPDITIYSKSLDTVVTRIRETTSSQHPNDVRNRWNGLFEELGNQLNYGDILGIKVNQSYGSNANQNGKNTWVSRENELVTETEGFDTAYYELTEDGLKLLELSAYPNKQNVDYGTDVEKIDYTNYVKDVKIGEVVVPKEQYTAKLVGEFDTSKPGEQTIKVEVTLKEDPTHKIQVDVPVEIEGTLTIEVPDTLEFQDVKLSKKEQIGQRKTEKPTGFKVTDSRGTGKQGGWYVTAQAITAEEIGIDDYLIYKQINGVSENLTDTVKIHQQEEQGNTEGPLTVDLTSWWTDSSGILLKIPKENTLRPNMDYQATLVFNIIEAP
ncbi:TPA: hypothetical protein QFL65_002434, partial [Enterococcus faecium]